jgi:glycosyltransferase involved in cell wall biosynthesis
MLSVGNPVPLRCHRTRALEEVGRLLSNLRVLFVNSQTEFGGAEISLLTALRELDRSKVEPVVITLGFGDGNLPQAFRAAGIPVEELHAGAARNPFAWLQTVTRLSRTVRQMDAALIVSNGYHPHCYAAPAARLLGTKRVLFCRDFVRNAGWRPNAEGFAWLFGADMYLAATQAVLSEVRKRVPDNVPVRVVPSGIDLSVFRRLTEEGAQLRRDLGLDDSDLVITMPGRLQEWKGQHVFLKACAAVAGKLERARLVIAGGTLFGCDKAYASELRELAKSLGIEGITSFTGHLEDMPALYSMSDVVVHASISPEPFGRVIAEAMACERPVVIARAGGASELLTEGVTGLGHEPGNVNALSAAILRLCMDDALRDELGKAGRELVAGNYTAEMSGQAMGQALSALMAEAE